jgi:hypothetical protein
VSESKAHFDRFLKDTLLASMPIQGGFSDQPQERTAGIGNLVIS